MRCVKFKLVQLHHRIMQYSYSQDPKCVRGIFRVLDVDEDNVRMSKFVRRNLGLFEKGKVFYEFNKKEDLICCRKTIRVTEAMVC